MKFNLIFFPHLPLPASLKPTRALNWKLLQVDAPLIPAVQLAHLVQQVPTAVPLALAGNSMATSTSLLVGYYNDVALGAAATNLGIAPVFQRWHLVVVVYIGSCTAGWLVFRMRPAMMPSPLFLFGSL